MHVSMYFTQSATTNETMFIYINVVIIYIVASQFKIFIKTINYDNPRVREKTDPVTFSLGENVPS